MASPTYSAERTHRPPPREYEYEEGLDDVLDEDDVQSWCEDFRQAASEITLCGGCGLPTGLVLSLQEWLDHPPVCRFCLAETH